VHSKTAEERIFAVTELTLEAAQNMVALALETARHNGMKPLAVAVLDERGALRAFAAEDGTSLRRANIAFGKANGALAMGLGSRTLAKRARDLPHFMAAVIHVVDHGLIPAPGGVLIRNTGREIIGAVGISGDTSENDELAALGSIAGAGYVADPGSDSD
jgi:uncharacterized protein GlcG (DUF336 family)